MTKEGRLHYVEKNRFHSSGVSIRKSSEDLVRAMRGKKMFTNPMLTRSRFLPTVLRRTIFRETLRKN